MLPFPKLLLVMLGLNLFGSFVFYFASVHHPSALQDLRLSTTQDFYTQTTTTEPEPEPEPPRIPDKKKPEDFSTPISGEKVAAQEIYKTEAVVDPYAPEQTFTRLTNPFWKLGAYPDIRVSLPYGAGFEYPLIEMNYGIENEEDYCERVDYYNLANPQNIFENLNFFSDFAYNTVVRKNVILRIGKDTKPEIDIDSTIAPENNYTLDVSINTFYMDKGDFHRYHQIGKNFLCATQMYNQIPGSAALVQKSDLIESVKRWAAKHSARSFCFNETTYFPKSYRLSNQEECDSFFNKLKSKRYQKSLESEPIQYILKSGHESESGDGVHLLDKETTEWLNEEFRYGTKCGKIDTSLIAQTYIANPLLLNNTKFDFRVYMLIASTNPLIIYSHDGYLRTSVSPYDKFSTKSEKHLTSSHVAYDAFMKAREDGTYNGKTEEELREAHILPFEYLQKYLLDTGKITDENWLENYLRPQFKKVMIHLVKMTSQYYVKLSNIYGLFGLDFMLDDELNLWFIDITPNPEMTAANKLMGEALNKVVRSLFEIEYGLYRSRMKRALDLITKLKRDEDAGYPVNIANWKAQYQEDEIKNRFEPEFRMSKQNSFSLVTDEFLPGADAYRGYIDMMCVFHH